jgi:hypothetical protein
MVLTRHANPRRINLNLHVADQQIGFPDRCYAHLSATTYAEEPVSWLVTELPLTPSPAQNAGITTTTPAHVQTPRRQAQDDSATAFSAPSRPRPTDHHIELITGQALTDATTGAKHPQLRSHLHIQPLRPIFTPPSRSSSTPNVLNRHTDKRLDSLDRLHLRLNLSIMEIRPAPHKANGKRALIHTCPYSFTHNAPSGSRTQNHSLPRKRSSTCSIHSSDGLPHVRACQEVEYLRSRRSTQNGFPSRCHPLLPVLTFFPYHERHTSPSNYSLPRSP